jgi:PAS domain S-box-containing protein
MAEGLAGLGYWRVDVATGDLRWSPNMFRIFGFEPGPEPFGAGALARVHPDDRAAADARMAALREGTPGEGPTRLIWPDGSIRYTEGRAACEFGPDGAVTALFGIVMDVTERHATDAALAEQQAQLALLADQGGDMIIEVGLDGRIRYASPSVSRFGFQSDRLVGAPVRDLVHPDDLQRFKALGLSLLAGEPEGSDRSYRVLTPDGGHMWVEGSPTLIRDPSGNPTGAISVLRDITERRAAEAALAESEAQLRVISENTRDMVIQYGLDRRILYVSPASRRYGYEPEDLIGRLSSDLVHPEDVDQVQALVADLFAGGPIDPERDRTHRLRAASGDYVWMEGQPTIVRDDQGRPTSVVSLQRDITERRAAEAALAESERRYRLIADHTQDMIAVCDPSRVLIFVSPSAESLLGYRPDEMVGRRALEFMHPDDHEMMARAISSYAAAGPGAPSSPLEYRAIRKDGREVWFESHPRTVFDAQGRLVELQDNIRDVTARKASQQAMVESERRYRLLAENATDIVSRTNLDGTFSYLSPAFQRVLGYEPEEFLGRSPMSEVHPDDAKSMAATFGAVLSGQGDGSPVSYRVRHKSGDWIWVEGNPTLVRDAEGRPLELIDVTRDVTLRHRLEDELRDARDAAEAAAAVKSDFMANMSHEIRTPLTAVLGFSSLLSARADLDPAAREHADRIAAAGRALLALVNDVLDFSKLEAGRVEITRRPANPAAIGRESLDLFSLQAESKGLELAFDPAPDLPACLSLDSKAVGQVLLNLLGNAVKFSEAGDVGLSLAYDADAQVLRVGVRDSGPGLSPEQAARLFQRFSQVDGSSTRRHGGTGLGLAICKGLVEAMGGEIGVDSVVGQGSTFWFSIPAPPATPVRQQADGQEQHIDLEGLRILVVDDNPINRELVRAILQPMGVEVAEAVDGLNGLDIASGLPFDLILLDIRMPGLDGPGVLARLRAEDGPNREVPILAFSADFDVGGVAGFDDFVAKPLNPAALIGAIAHWTAYQTEPEDIDASTA